MYLILAMVGGIVGGIAVDGHARRAHAARHADLRQSRGVQRLRHRARPDHGVLHGHAGDHGRVRQLDGAADDRRPRHGLPAHEQHLVLAAVRLVLVCWSPRLFMPGPPGTNGVGGGWTIYAPLSHQGHARHRHGLRHPVAASRRRLVDPRRHQLHHHHLQHARAGHDAAQDAAVRLGGAGDRLPAAPVAAGAGRRHHHAADRPQFRHGVLRLCAWRRSAAVAASVLVLRPSRSLHPHHAGLRHRQPDRLDLLAGSRSSAISAWPMPWSPSA